MSIAVQCVSIDVGGQGSYDAAGPVVKSASRALQILEFFDAVQREAPVSEISRALNFPQSSTSVLLRSLVAMGYLHHDRLRRTYLPTRRVSLLGNWVDPALMQQGSLLGTVEKLAGKSGQTVVMATVNGLFSQYIYVTRRDDRPRPATGILRALPTTAVGLALLSTYDDSQIARIVRRLNAERSEEEEAISVTDVLDTVRMSRARGYFRGAGVQEGQSGIAILLDRHRQLLALGIEGDPCHMDDCDRQLSILCGSGPGLRMDLGAEVALS